MDNVKISTLYGTQKCSVYIASSVPHQIDVYWEFIFNSCKYKCIFECKDYKNKISKEKVATLDSISRDIVDSIPIIVSTKGFQSGAQAYAQSKNVTPFICRELTDEDWEDRVRSFEIHLIILGKPNVKLNIKKDTQWCEKNGYTNFKITNLKKAKIVDNEKNEIIEVELYIKNWLGLEYDAKKEEISFNNANIVYEPDCVDFKFLSIALDVTYDKTEEVIMIDGDDYIQGLVIDVVNDSRAIIMKNGEIKKINEK